MKQVKTVSKNNNQPGKRKEWGLVFLHSQTANCKADEVSQAWLPALLTITFILSASSHRRATRQLNLVNTAGLSYKNVFCPSFSSRFKGWNIIYMKTMCLCSAGQSSVTCHIWSVSISSQWNWNRYVSMLIDNSIWESNCRRKKGSIWLFAEISFHYILITVSNNDVPKVLNSHGFNTTDKWRISIDTDTLLEPRTFFFTCQMNTKGWNILQANCDT